MSWEKEFHDPIELPNGKILRTLRDAGHYVASLSKATQSRPEWQAAAQALLLVVEANGDTMLARIGMMQALNATKLVEPAPRRKRAKKHRVIR